MKDALDVSDKSSSAEEAVINQLGSMSTVEWWFKDPKERLYLTKS